MEKKLEEKISDASLLERENDPLLQLRQEILKGEDNYDLALMKEYVESRMPSAPYD